jgi:hypothetical protein
MSQQHERLLDFRTPPCAQLCDVLLARIDPCGDVAFDRLTQLRLKARRLRSLQVKSGGPGALYRLGARRSFGPLIGVGSTGGCNT